MVGRAPQNSGQPKERASYARQRDQVQRRIAEGVSAESDLVLAPARLEAIQADVMASRAQGDMALARLGHLLGRPVAEATLASTLDLPRPVQAQSTGLLDQALEQSAAVQKGQTQVRVQEATVAERQADLLPEVYVRAERQYGNFNFANGAPENRLFVGVSSRLGAGLSGLSNVAAARGQLEAAAAEVQVQTRAPYEQVLADHALAVSSELRLTSVRASLRSAQSVSESTTVSFWQDAKLGWT
jgi:adhesin transport system outer membrane protein